MSACNILNQQTKKMDWKGWGKGRQVGERGGERKGRKEIPSFSSADITQI
jgi:hypothetical protein